MMDRRQFNTTAISALAAPALLWSGRGWGQGRDARLSDIAQITQGMTQLRAILIQRGARIVLERAWRGPSLDRPAAIKSCSKSLVALLVADALARKALPSLQARLGDLTPRLIPDDADPRVASITIEDLLTMRAGLQSTSHARYGAWIASQDWVAYALSRPMEAPSGGKMIYSTASTHVLGAVLAELTGEDLLSQMRRVLAAPLKIDLPPWVRDPQGRYLGGNEMALSPRAMLRVAVMMRDFGRFEGRQVIARDWIDASRKPRVYSDFSRLDYGYGWFVTPQGFMLARGYGGQIIAAHPERDLAVAITSDPDRPATSDGHFGDLLRLIEGPITALALV